MPTTNNPKRPWIKSNPTPQGANQGRQNPNREIYGSQRWRVVSKLNLQRNPLCAECEKVGIVREAKVTDHDKPINQGGDPWDPENHRSLCYTCHQRKSAKERHQKKP